MLGASHGHLCNRTASLLLKIIALLRNSTGVECLRLGVSSFFSV